MAKLKKKTEPILFSYQEVVECLVKRAGIHEGLWGLRIGFGIGATNMPVSQEDVFSPSAIVPITEIGIQVFDRPSNLTVDASVFNPKEPRPAATKRIKPVRRKKT